MNKGINNKDIENKSIKNKGIKNKGINLFVLNVVSLFLLILLLVVSINYSIDASGVITPGSYYEMADLALAGNTIITQLNYNERLYQVAIVQGMKKLPDTIVIGCSRGMFLGEDITGFKNLYNNCVSGANIEDYCALLGLYDKKFSKIPKRVIIETSPWIFYRDNPESRWKEQEAYSSVAKEYYEKINSKPLINNRAGENPYLSIPYFRHNVRFFLTNGFKAFQKKTAKIRTDETEHVEYPDGSVGASLENKIDERLKAVRATNGAVTYQNADKMTELDQGKISDYENLLDFLLMQGVEVLIYMQPFSVTQCHYSYDEGKNAVFKDVEAYLHELGLKKHIKVIGGFDARVFGLKDENFTDFMHLDKKGTRIVWNMTNSQLMY